MSIRLNKLGNIPEAVPYTTTSAVGFTGSSNGAYFQSNVAVEPFYGASMIGKTFAGYKGGLLGPSGATISYAGTGTWKFRANKKDYFLAAFDITPLFDPERVTPALVGITASCNPVTLSSLALPQIFPMVIWADRNNTIHKAVRSYCILPPTLVARFTAGVSNNVVGYTGELEISPFLNGVRKDVFFGYFVGREYPKDSQENVSFPQEYQFKDMTISMCAASLKGNRPVFDPVMV